MPTSPDHINESAGAQPTLAPTPDILATNCWGPGHNGAGWLGSNRGVPSAARVRESAQTASGRLLPQGRDRRHAGTDRAEGLNHAEEGCRDQAVG